MVEVGGIALDGVVAEHADALIFQPPLVGFRRLPAEAGDDHAAHIQPRFAEGVDEAQRLRVVADAQVAAQLVGFDVLRVDGDHHLGAVGQRFEHAQFAVGLKAGQDARGVVVVKQFAAKFQIQLAAELLDALADALGLQADVHVVVKSLPHHTFLPSMAAPMMPASLPRRASSTRAQESAGQYT